ncbi:MAG: hypothetical protein OK422_04975 [Thaumarchaeota archaeon]|nr:hypothetical protein [Nitrososphaerota archaeon]
MQPHAFDLKAVHEAALGQFAVTTTMIPPAIPPNTNKLYEKLAWTISGESNETMT